MIDHDKLRALLDENGYDQMDIEDAVIWEGSLEDYAIDYISDCYGLPEIAASYFNYEAFAKDLIMGGDVVELTNYRNDERTPRYFAVREDRAIWLLNP